MIQVLLADDHEIVRTGIRRILQDTGDIKIIAEAKNGEEAVLLTQQLKPDVLLMDLNMPDTDGFSASIQLLSHPSPPKILLISGQEEHILIPRFLKMGAFGYTSKNIPPEKLKEIIRAIHGGEKHFDITLSIDTSPFAILSDRELQVALMVARGMESEEIAARLFLSKKTVHGYHRDSLKKLNLKKDVELVRLILQYKLVDLDSVHHLGKKHIY